MPNTWDTQKSAPAMSPPTAVRLFFGVVLLIFGLIVAGIMLKQIKAVVFGETEPGIVQRLSPSSTDDLAILIGNAQDQRRIQLPPKTLPVIGYFFSLIAMLVTAKIVSFTIRGGISLLSSPVEKPPGPA